MLAQKRIHLMEEELRRTRMEAEKYKGSWIRQKKRVAELESASGSGNKLNGSEVGGSGGGGGGNSSVWNDHFTSSNLYGDNNASGGAAAQDVERGGGYFTVENVELRKVTPNISNDDGDTIHRRSATTNHRDDDDADDRTSRRTKRKYQNIGNIRAIESTSQAIVGITSSDVLGDSVRRRVARLLLSRDEMGCHTLGGSDHATLFSSAPVDDAVKSKVAVAESLDQINEIVQMRQGLQPDEDAKIQNAMHDHRIEREMRAFVKSILYQMAEAPDGVLDNITSANGVLSVSGLFHVLLVRFNSLFNSVDVKNDITAPVDGEGDHATMELESDSNPSSSTANKYEYQRMVLLAHKCEGSQTMLVTYATVSWRAVLYLLSVLHDILLLSDKAREDLRLWVNQSQQTIEQSGCTIGDNFNSLRAEVLGRMDTDGIVTHSRIEGIERKMVLSTSNCNSRSSQQSNVWDPISMNQHCNVFFELIVGSMKGNVFYHLKRAGVTAGRESSDFLSEQEVLVQLVQLKAIELVTIAMSDALPDDHVGDDRGDRAHNLWRLWFEALVPPQSSDTQPIGDFFSPWEKSDPYCARNSLGSGRKHSTRLLKDNKGTICSHKTGDTERHGHNNNRASRGKSTPKTSSGDLTRFQENVKVHGHTAILIKCRILRFLSHVVLQSRSAQNSLYQSSDRGNKSSLAKRVLAAVLDCMEEYILSFLSSGTSPDIYHAHDAEQCFRLCFCCIQFLAIMTRTNEGVLMLRMQMRLESGAEEPSRWSQSAIGCMTSVLNCSLVYVQKLEKAFEMSFFQSNNFSDVLNSVVGACIQFFIAIHIFLEQESGFSSKAPTFVALVSEHGTLFQSCCQRILAYQSSAAVSDPPRLLRVSDELRNEVRDLLDALLHEAPLRS